MMLKTGGREFRILDPSEEDFAECQDRAGVAAGTRAEAPPLCTATARKAADAGATRPRPGASTGPPAPLSPSALSQLRTGHHYIASAAAPDHLAGACLTARMVPPVSLRHPADTIFRN
jgi:hypothetical protein